MDAEDARLEAPVPRAMVNLETWLPTNFQVGSDISRSKALAVRRRPSGLFPLFLLGIRPDKTGRQAGAECDSDSPLEHLI